MGLILHGTILCLVSPVDWLQSKILNAAYHNNWPRDMQTTLVLFGIKSLMPLLMFLCTGQTSYTYNIIRLCYLLSQHTKTPIMTTIIVAHLIARLTVHVGCHFAHDGTCCTQWLSGVPSYTQAWYVRYCLDIFICIAGEIYNSGMVSACCLDNLYEYKV